MTLPQALEPYDAELSVIGAAFIDSATVARSGCVVSDFADARHRAVWGVIMALVGEGAPVDCVTVTTRLEARGSLEAAGGAEYVADLDGAAGSTLSVEHHGGIVRDAAWARRASRLVADMAPAVLRAITAGAEHGDVRGAARRALSTVAGEAIAALSDDTATHGWQTMREARAEMVRRTGERYNAANSEQGVPDDVLPTGIGALDADIGGGLEAGHLCVVDGESGSGKTALMVSIARAQAVHLHRQGPPERAGLVLYYSCEVSGADLAVRDVARLGGVNGLSMRSGRMTDGDLDRMLQAVKRSAGDDHWRIGYRPSAPVEWLVSEVRLIEETVGAVRSVIVDHWNELITLRRGLRSDEREMAHILTQLDGLKAPTAKCPTGRVVIVGAQHKATGGGLLWGNALRMKASYCWTWKAPGKGLPDDATGQAVVDRWKMRNGPLGQTRLAWHPETGRIGSPRSDY